MKYWIAIFSIVILLVVAGVYLNRAYAYIYSTIGAGGFHDLFTSQPVLISFDTASGTPITYVAMGDSLTAGIGVNRKQDSFPYLFAEKLSKEKKQSVNLVNLGIPGGTTQTVIDDELSQAVMANPDVVTLVIGVNDIHSFVSTKIVVAHLNIILQTLTEKTHARILVTTIPFIGTHRIFYPPYFWYYHWQTKRYNSAIQSVLHRYLVTVVDLYTENFTALNSNPKYYSRDSFHPNVAGYQLWAQFLYDNFRK